MNVKMIGSDKATPIITEMMSGSMIAGMKQIATERARMV